MGEEYKLSVNIHTQHKIGHVWLSIFDKEGKQTDIELQPHPKFGDELRSSAFNQFLLQKSPALFGLSMTLSTFYHSMLGDIDYNLGIRTADFRQDAEKSLEVTISETQYNGIISNAKELQVNPGKYQLLDVGINAENCFSVLSNILLKSGVDLELIAPSNSFVERIPSPQSFAERIKRKEHITHKKADESGLSWVTRVANQLETKVREL